MRPWKPLSPQIRIGWAWGQKGIRRSRIGNYRKSLEIIGNYRKLTGTHREFIGNYKTINVFQRLFDKYELIIVLNWLINISELLLILFSAI